MNLIAVHRKQADAPTNSHSQRQAHILELLNANGFQSTDDLAASFQVSPQTIRRDVNALAMQGLCRRSHGGIWPLQGSQQNIDYSDRRAMGYEAKQRIAALVALHVPDGASIFLGIGTTLELCAQALAHKQGLRVMTNNLNAALVLSRNPDTQVTVTGGRIRNTDFDVVSGEAHGFFDRYTVDIGIYGIGAVAADGMLLDFHEDEARMRSELARNCRRRFLAFDHSKHERGATVRHGHITEADCVFTDLQPPPHILTMLADKGRQVLLSDGPSPPPSSRASPMPQQPLTQPLTSASSHVLASHLKDL